MLVKTRSAAVYGIDAYMVDVEVDASNSGQSNFMIVGLPDTAVRESHQRVRAALKNCGHYFGHSVTVNLAPADKKKEGSGFDLPMAMGILGTLEAIHTDRLKEFVFVGELSLDGGLRPVRGALPIAVQARDAGIANLILPAANACEAAVVDGVSVFGMNSLAEVVALVNGAQPFTPTRVDLQQALLHSNNYAVDFREVRGQQSAKRALEVSAAGAHNILMIGPPGSGKTMLAKRLPTVLPPLSFAEAIQTTKIHSVAGVLDAAQGLVGTRPFRSPHHTISDAGLVGGGGNIPHPGEVSLAHNGVLFLDELPEFRRNVLEVMRQPLEDGMVTIARASMTLSFPARFMLAAAMNPCPCGFFNDPTRECSCTPAMIQRYVAKISGPLLDRIDIHMDVPAVKYRELRAEESAEGSTEIRARVERARDVQIARFQKDGIYANSQMSTRLIRRHCVIDEASEKLLERAITRMGLSARAHDRILKVARTIADLEGVSAITAIHIGEAVQYRSLDRTYWA